MNNNHFAKHLILFVLISNAISCNKIPRNVKDTLELAGENRKELQAVIDHYQSPEDSLKLKAAYFLIGNMSDKFFYPYNKAQQNLINFLKKLRKEETFNETVDSIPSYWKNLKNKYGMYKPEAIRDAEVVSAKLLIENIDYAFAAWESAPWSKQHTFEQFCTYVLPYRTNNDIPGFWRKDLYEKYKWVLDSIPDSDFLYACNLLNDSISYTWNSALEEFSHTDIQDMNAIRTAICRQHSSMKVAALRSIGIPTAEVEGLLGTSWVIVPDKNGRFWGWESQEPPKQGAPFIDDLRYEDYPKVFMYTYESGDFPFLNILPSDVPPIFYDTNRIDVTKNHSDAMDVKLNLSISQPQKTNYAFLCIFNGYEKNWTAAHWSRIENNTVFFDQMGLGCMYLPMYYSNMQYYPAGNPIFLSKEQKIIDLKLDLKTKETVKLRRKARPNYWENFLADLMINDVFEGANHKDFSDATVIYKIKERGTYYEEKASITNQKFRYVRYRNSPNKLIQHKDIRLDLHIAEIAFYGDKNQILDGKRIASTKVHFQNIEMAFDNNIRTNFVSDSLCWIGLDLEKPTEITKVKYLFRNSFNTIEPNDEYELYYWDNEWKSLGRQFATDDYLKYEVPRNAVFWLKNLTKGKEEMVFFMQDGKQVWAM